PPLLRVSQAPHGNFVPKLTNITNRHTLLPTIHDGIPQTVAEMARKLAGSRVIVDRLRGDDLGASDEAHFHRGGHRRCSCRLSSGRRSTNESSGRGAGRLQLERLLPWHRRRRKLG